MAIRGQQVTVLPVTKKSTGQKKYIIIHRKTGYFDFWLNDKHFYYNLRTDINDDGGLTPEQIANYQNVTGKRVIIVRRRRLSKT